VDVGCLLVPKKADWGFDPIFISGISGNWIRINGQQIALTRAEKEATVAKGWEEFVAPDVQVLIKYGRSHQREGGGDYPRVIFKVTYKGEVRISHVKGSCGC
jgi:hypothetical protein